MSFRYQNYLKSQLVTKPFHLLNFPSELEINLHSSKLFLESKDNLFILIVILTTKVLSKTTREPLSINKSSNE